MCPYLSTVGMESNHCPRNRYFLRHLTLEINLNIYHWPLVLYPRKKKKKKADSAFKIKGERTDISIRRSQQQLQQPASVVEENQSVCCLKSSTFLVRPCLFLWVSGCKGGINLPTVSANTSLEFQTQQFGLHFQQQQKQSVH